MTTQKTCPCCGQPVPILREGVRLTPLKARLFDIIKRAGPQGILPAELWRITCEDGHERRTFKTLKVHIWQINDAIEDTGLRIDGRSGYYRLIRKGAENGIQRGISGPRRAASAHLANGTSPDLPPAT